MSPELVLSQEMSAGPARLRVDVLGGPARESIVDDMDFLNYRLAAVTHGGRRHARRARRDLGRRG